MDQESSRAHVLVLEHDPGLSTPLLRALLAEGHTALLAEDGHAAFRAIAISKPEFDVILCGLHFPDAPGRLLLRRIRPLVEGRTPVIVVSAEAHLRDAVRDAHDWLFMVLDDPADLVRINHVVETAVRSKRRAAALRAIEDPRDRRTQVLVDEIERLFREVRIDRLTGLPTRLRLQEQFDWLTTVKGQFGGSFVVALMDVDRFRTVNETCGYEGGDRVIAEFAGLVRSCMRDGDSLYRYGGDEFVALLQANDLREGVMAIERIQLALADAPAITVNEDTEFKITVSAGVAVSLTQFRPTLDTLLRKATRHLKDAKAAGGGCVRPLIHSRAGGT